MRTIGQHIQVLISFQTHKLGARLPDDQQRQGSMTKWINRLRMKQKNVLIVALRVIIPDDCNRLQYLCNQLPLTINTTTHSVIDYNIFVIDYIKPRNIVTHSVIDYVVK